MKTTKILAFGLLVAVCGAGCKALARQFVPYIERWGNGLTKREGRLEGDAQSGEWTYFFESGQRRAHGRYENDRQVGAWTYWFENGGVEWSGTFDPTGKRTDEWTFFHADGTMRARGRYVADFEDGPWEFFHPDGSLERAGQFDAGKMSGPWVHDWPGGRRKAEGLCHRGQRIGSWKIVDEAGKAGVQDCGLRQGVEIALETWPDGKPKRTGVLQDGVPTGRWTSWHENGALRFCCSMTGGRPSGIFEARDEQGKVTASGVLDAPTLAALPAAVALAATEIGGPVDSAARAPRLDPTTTPPPAASPAAVAAITAEPERMPAPMQPSFTIAQEKDRDAIVDTYRDGASPSRPSLKKYPTDGGKAPAGSGSGPRQLTELEGKPLPIDVLKAVDGKDVDLREFRGKKKLLLVVLRGFLGEVCIYCVAQTEALAQCRTELEALGIEVLVLYPGPKENEQSFEQAYAMTFGKGAPPYRVFYDPDLEAVQKLGIAGDLAYPTTMIVDQDGIVQYAYVGKDRADRPAAKALIKKIKELKQ